MKKQIFALGLLTFSTLYFAQEKGTDSLNIRTIEDVKLHKTGNPNKAKTFTTKSNLDVMENPQAVSVVTHEIIEQQQAQQLSDVLKNVNGVYVTSSRGSSQDSFGARGYIFGADNIYKNGARVNSGIFPEVSGMERVEVLKGSTAILYGNVAPGGIINMITKKPLFTEGGSATVSAGSWNNYKVGIDYYNALTNKAAFRVNGAYENKESFRNGVTSEKYYFNPSFLFNLSDKTQLIVEGDYLKQEFTPDFGIGTLVLDANTSRSVINDLLDTKANPGISWQNQINQMATSTVTLNHTINSKWGLNAVASYQNYTRDFFGSERMQWMYESAKNDYYWDRTAAKNYQEQNYVSMQVNLNGEFSTGKIKHKLLFGGDADYLQADTYTFSYLKNDGSWTPNGDSTVKYGTNGDTNLGKIYLSDQSTWASGDVPETRKRDLVRTPTRRVGFYIQDLISVTEKFKILAGVRWSYLENKPVLTTTYYNNTKKGGALFSQNAFSPRFGLVYQWNENFTTFASYSNSFTPNTGTDIYKVALPASIIDQWELGIKKNLWNNALAFNVTAYQITNSNLAQIAPFDADGNANIVTTIKELTGKTRSRGVEVDITGNPLTNLSIIAGYSYNHMVYLETANSLNSSIEGERV